MFLDASTWISSAVETRFSLSLKFSFNIFSVARGNVYLNIALRVAL